MKLSEKEISLIQDFFSKEPVLKAYLFGSFARGDADNTSDIDLLVELDYTSPIGLHFFKMQDDLQTALHKNVDIVSSQGVSKHIFPFIEKEMELIYEKQAG